MEILSLETFKLDEIHINDRPSDQYLPECELEAGNKCSSSP